MILNLRIRITPFSSKSTSSFTFKNHLYAGLSVLVFGTIIIIVDRKEMGVRKRKVIKEARQLYETGMRTNCQVCRRFANMLEQIEYRSDMIEYQTMVLVVGNLRHHITTKHLLLS